MTTKRIASFSVWLLLAIMVVLLSGFHFRGARETVLEISSLGWRVIAAAALCGGLLMAVGLVRASRAGAIDVSLVQMRTARMAAWLAWITSMSAGIAFLVGLFTWMWIQTAIRNLPAETLHVGGEVVDLSRSSPIGRFCRFHVHVQLDDGSVEEICAERGWINRATPASLLALKEHDRVMVSLRCNALGTTASIAAE